MSSPLGTSYPSFLIIATGMDGVQALARTLETNQTLLHLNVRSCGLGANHIHFLAEAMNYNHHILAFDVEYAKINLDDARLISSAIQRNRGLQKRRVCSGVLCWSWFVLRRVDRGAIDFGSIFYPLECRKKSGGRGC